MSRTRNVPHSALMTAFEQGRLSVWEEACIASQNAYEAGFAAAEAEYDKVIATLLASLPDDVLDDIRTAIALALDTVTDTGEPPF